LVQEHEWNSTFDGGRFTLDQLSRVAHGDEPLVLVVNALVVVASVVLLLALLVERAPVVVAFYALFGTISAVGAAGYPNSKARFLLCVFPLLVPLVRVLARAPADRRRPSARPRRGLRLVQRLRPHRLAVLPLAPPGMRA
jgi:hypothetical protein